MALLQFSCTIACAPAQGSSFVAKPARLAEAVPDILRPEILSPDIPSDTAEGAVREAVARDFDGIRTWCETGSQGKAKQ